MADIGAGAEGAGAGERRDMRMVIVASALGTLFEWYDFFLYASVAALLGAKFFPSGNPAAALLASLAAFGAGFGIRPLGAILFGIVGDVVGRKKTFLITITLMGLATAAIGFLPTYETSGLWGPSLLVTCRLLQGLALGGEYGGAAIYVAEHAPEGKRGFYTSWVQGSVAFSFLLCLAVVLGCRKAVGDTAFDDFGWRIPFLLSLIMLAISLYIRMKLSESPVFAALKEGGGTSRNPFRDSFASWTNTKRMLVVLFGVAAGLTVIFYTAQFSGLYFLQQIAGLDYTTSYFLVGAALLIASPFYILSGWLSDKIGRKKILLSGYVLTLLVLMPAFKGVAMASNPKLFAAMERAPVRIEGSDCVYNVFAKTQTTDCGKAIDYFTKRSIGYQKEEQAGGLKILIGGHEIQGVDPDGWEKALLAAGYPAKGAGGEIDKVRIVMLITSLTILSAMTYGQVGALMVELFPARIRYTSLSIPYHFGTGYFGGFQPFIAQFIVVKTGDVFSGLWYTLGVVGLALLVSALFLPETRGEDITA